MTTTQDRPSSHRASSPSETSTHTNTASQSTTTSQDAEKPKDGSSDIVAGRPLEGWRFRLMVVAMFSGSFISVMELSVVITALVAITDDLKDFANATWLVSSYLLTWSGFLILWAQFSGVIGRKSCYVTALCGFIIFSAACAGAQTMVQLIILRAFQGIAGAGVHNLSIVVLADAIRPEQWPLYTAIFAGVSAVSFAVGPLIGGAIATNLTWRWVFIINVPLGCMTLALLLLSVPSGFPDHRLAKRDRPKFTLNLIGKLDHVGALLFLGTTIMLVTALQEVIVAYAWRSAETIALIALAGFCLIFFTIWERTVHVKGLEIEPMLSWHFTRKRSFGLLSSALLIGVTFTTPLVQIPQQFQIVNGLSAYDAGKKLIAYLIMAPAGGAMGSVLVGRLKLPLWIGLWLGAIFQLVPAVCFATVPLTVAGKPLSYIPARQYGFQILLGIGNGMSNAISTSYVPWCAYGDKPLISPLGGANVQFRFAGGAIGLGIITAVFHQYSKNRLDVLLPPDTVHTLLQSTTELAYLPPQTQEAVIGILTKGFQLQWKVIAGLIGGQFLTSLIAM